MVTEVHPCGSPTCGRTEDILQGRNMELSGASRISPWALFTKGGQRLEAHRVKDESRWFHP